MKRQTIIFAVLFSISGTLSAQWMQTNGPNGGNIQSIAVSGTNLYAGVGKSYNHSPGSGVYRSTDEGVTWERKEIGLISPSPVPTALLSYGATVFAGTREGIFRSLDEGNNWKLVGPGVFDLWGNEAILLGSPYHDESCWGRCIPDAITLSTDGGETWDNLPSGAYPDPSAFTMMGSVLIVGVYGSIYQSTDGGASWVYLGRPVERKFVRTLNAVNGFIYAGTEGGGIFRSADSGKTWSAMNNGLTNLVVHAITVHGADLFTGTDGGVFRSTDGGASWTEENAGLGDTSVHELAVMGTTLFAGTPSGIYRSSDGGASWRVSNDGILDLWVSPLTSIDKILLAGGESLIHLSSDNGATWEPANLPFNNFTQMVEAGPDLFCGTSNDGVFLSTNHGISWTSVNDGLTNTSVRALATSGSNVYAGTGGGVFLSTNNGTTWTAVNTGLTNSGISCLATDGSNLFAGTWGGGVFLTTNNGAVWTAVNNGLTNSAVRAFAAIGPNLFAGTWGGGVFLSTNNGAIWTAVNTGLTNPHVWCLATVGPNLFAGTWGGVFLSTNNAATWTAVNTGLVSTFVSSFATIGPTLFAGTGCSVWRRPLSEMIPNPIITVVADVPSDQGGKVSLFWSPTHLDTNITTHQYYSVWRSILPPPAGIVRAHRATVITADFKGPAYRTTIINGTEYAWEWIGNQPAHRFAEYSYSAPTLYDSVEGNNGMHYFLVSAHTSDPNVFHDSNVDSGSSVDNLSPSPPENFTGNHAGNTFMLRWDANAEPDMHHYEIYRSGNPGFNPDTITSLSAVESTNFTDNLMLPIPTYYYVVRAVDIHGNRSAKSAEVSTVLVGVEEAEALPTEYALSQNYPNPFNPVTSISYALPEKSEVRLVVFNLLGEEVATLVNGEQDAGFRTAVWNASGGVGSGVYFCRMTATSVDDPGKTFVQLRKMVLMK